MSADLDNLLEDFDEEPPTRVTHIGSSRVEITWYACNETVEIRIVAGDGQLLVTGIEPFDEVRITLCEGAAQAFWESLQQRPPAEDLFSGPDWPPRPGGEGSGG